MSLDSSRPQCTLTRTVGFRASHRYHRPEWSAEENRTAFGALGDPPGHAHDYTCAVTVGGPVDPREGMVMDLGALDRILAEEVVRHLDGRHVNLELPEFAYGGTLPTCEALAAYLYRRIAPRLPTGVALVRVRLAEDPTLYADCTGVA